MTDPFPPYTIAIFNLALLSFIILLTRAKKQHQQVIRERLGSQKSQAGECHQLLGSPCYQLQQNLVLA